MPFFGEAGGEVTSVGAGRAGRAGRSRCRSERHYGGDGRQGGHRTVHAIRRIAGPGALRPRWPVRASSSRSRAIKVSAIPTLAAGPSIEP